MKRKSPQELAREDEQMKRARMELPQQSYQPPQQQEQLPTEVAFSNSLHDSNLLSSLNSQVNSLQSELMRQKSKVREFKMKFPQFNMPFYQQPQYQQNQFAPENEQQQSSQFRGPPPQITPQDSLLSRAARSFISNAVSSISVPVLLLICKQLVEITLGNTATSQTTNVDNKDARSSTPSPRIDYPNTSVYATPFDPRSCSMNTGVYK
jgi:hypothetical protein